MKTGNKLQVFLSVLNKVAKKNLFIETIQCLQVIFGYKVIHFLISGQKYKASVFLWIINHTHTHASMHRHPLRPV